MSQKDIKYFLTPDELSVLLAGRGISHFYGLSRLNYQIDDKALCLALHNMYVNQIIQNENEEGFLIDAELAAIMDGIKRAKKRLVAECHGTNGVTRGCCMKDGDAWIVLEEVESLPDKISIYSLEEDAFFVRLAELQEGSAPRLSLVDADTGASRTLASGESEGGISREEIEACFKEG